MNNLPQVREKKEHTCKKDGNYHSCACCISWGEQQLQEELQEELKASKIKHLEFIRTQNERLGLPLRFKNAEFSDFKAKTDKQRQTITKIKKYAKSIIKGTHKGGFLTLLGGVGTGKTLLVSALARNLIQNKLTVKYQTTNQIVDTLSMAKRSYTMNIRAQINCLTQFDILIIDEIGTQDQKDNNYLFEMVNQYYGAVKPMVLVSNYGIETLKVNTGERVVDRLKHNGTILGLDWRSFRK